MSDCSDFSDEVLGEGMFQLREDVESSKKLPAKTSSTLAVKKKLASTSKLTKIMKSSSTKSKKPVMTSTSSKKVKDETERKLLRKVSLKSKKIPHLRAHERVWVLLHF